MNAHDKARHKENIAFRIVVWLVTHHWIRGMALAGYGLAAEGYDSMPEVTPERFVIHKGKVV